MDSHVLDTYLASKGRHTEECIFCFPLREMVIAEEESYRIIADTFPLTEGHVLVSSHRHYGCLGDLPNSSILAISRMLQSIEFPFLAYEHGRAGTCGVNFNACEHFHLNIVPLSVTNVVESIDIRHTRTSLLSLCDLKKYYQLYGEYILFVENGDISFIYPEEPVPSHFMRTLCANAAGHPERADWSAIDNPELFAASLSYSREVYRDLL